ncbi:hypothetical protein ACJIZ3_012804 [Penstemon smallii]|uniref:Uncharacterized protein n=1 Tax=Penstemon smallii TaxID=265156 RepID=A0ABD3UN43_9LAMI
MVVVVSGRSSGRPFIRRAGSSSASSGVGVTTRSIFLSSSYLNSHGICDGISGCEDDSELPWKDWKEEMMLLPLEERCEIASEMYTKSIRESDVSFAAIFSKLLVGCHEKYFDVDSIARNFDRTMLEEERLDNEKRLMRWPLELRCRHVARAYAQGILGSDPHLVAMCKKLMVGCPEKYLDIAISSNKSKRRLSCCKYFRLYVVI